MKKLFLFASLVALSFSCILAQELQVNENGEIRVVEPEHTWRPLTAEEKLAHDSLGVLVPIGDPSISYQRFNFFQYQIILQYHQAVVFTGQRFLILDKQTLKNSYTIYAIYIIYSFIALFCMLLGHISLLKKKFTVVYPVGAIIFLLVGALTAAVYQVGFDFYLGTLISILIAVVIILFDKNKIILKKLAIYLFYIVTALTMFL